MNAELFYELLGKVDRRVFYYAKFYVDDWLEDRLFCEKESSFHLFQLKISHCYLARLVGDLLWKGLSE